MYKTVVYTLVNGNI